MKPALSVIFFTVLSGAGLGLAFWWSLFTIRCQICAIGSSPRFALITFAWIFALVTIGLISSTLHLANPKNAWRAFSRFKTSWLSREGVLAVLFYPLLALFAAALWFGASRMWVSISAALVALCALAVLYCTGMIYACLKTIPQWHSWRTPVKYVLYGLVSGLLLFLAIASQTTDMNLHPALRFAAFALITALVFYSYVANLSLKEQTLNQALGVNEGRVRLLDVGHSHGTFLTNEFGFRVAREKAALISTLAVVLAFIVPIIIVVIESTPSAQGMLGLAALSCVLGLLCERWLFFANARHVVMRYHGQ